MVFVLLDGITALAISHLIVNLKQTLKLLRAEKSLKGAIHLLTTSVVLLNVLLLLEGERPTGDEGIRHYQSPPSLAMKSARSSMPDPSPGQP